MKLLLLLIIASAVAVEEHDGIKVQLCGARLAKSLKKVCEEKDIDFLLQHGLYNEETEHVNHSEDHRAHNHNHGEHTHNHGKHNHNHGEHKHNHDEHNHNHGEHNHNHSEHNHNHGEHNHVRKDNNDSCHHGNDHGTDEQQPKEGIWKLADECCAKPCLVKDFIAFCP